MSATHAPLLKQCNYATPPTDKTWCVGCRAEWPCKPSLIERVEALEEELRYETANRQRAEHNLSVAADTIPTMTQRVEALEEALDNIKSTFNRDNIRPGTAAFLMYAEASRALLASPTPEPRPAPLDASAALRVGEALNRVEKLLPLPGQDRATFEATRARIVRAIRAALTATEQEKVAKGDVQ